MKIKSDTHSITHQELIFLTKPSAANTVTKTKETCDMPQRIPLSTAISTTNAALRSLATFYIFIFHCNGLYGVSNFGLVNNAFAIFMFISGYYTYLNGKDINLWFKRRIKRIFIPYWIVMCGAILSNSIFKYKEVTLFEYAASLLGASFFLENKLYVISWFISIITIFYIQTFFVWKQKGTARRLVVAIMLSALAMAINIPPNFIFMYQLGLLTNIALSTVFSPDIAISVTPTKYKVYTVANDLVQILQKYSYDFFLLHGGVLIFFSKLIHAPYATTLLLALPITAILSIILHKTTDTIERHLNRIKY